MNEPLSGEFPSGSTDAVDAPTPEQAAALQYLGLAPAARTSRAQAGALIARAETDPANQETLRAWHREKYRLHPDLFAPPPRSFREARWWQARISPDTLYGYSFQQPSLDQTFVILGALDRQEPGWDQESGRRRETRFMNELATLSPELCKPGCVFPHDLPAEGAPEEAPAALEMPAPPAPSAPFVPGQYAASVLPFTPPSQPAWQPPVQLPGPVSRPAWETGDAPERSGGGAWKWVLLAVVLAAGAGAYYFLGFQPPALERGAGTPASAAGSPAANTRAATPARPATVAANASRQRAIAKYPDLAQAGTALNAKFVVTFRDLEAAHDPLLQQPDWPEQLAARCANILSSAKPTSARPTPAKLTPSKPLPTPTPAASRTAATAPSPAPPALTAPTVQKPVAPPATPPVAVAPGATPGASPAGNLFVTLDAVNKSRVNNYAYHWSPYYYADYDISFRQAVGVEVKVHNMARTVAAVNLRWMFFGRKTASNERYIFSASQKRLELPPGQTIADVLDSPMLKSTAAVSYSYGTHYYSGSKYEGWLVQVLPEGSDKVIAQVGSSGYAEDFGKRSDLTTLLKEQLGR